MMKTQEMIEIPNKAGDVKRFGQIKGSSRALAIKQIYNKRVLLVLATDHGQARELENELNCFFSEDKVIILNFPDWEILAYDNFSPHQDIISQRLKILYSLPNLTEGILILPISTAMHRLCPRKFIMENSFVLDENSTISIQEYTKQLIASGYQSNRQVMEHGEFSVRGSILDVFPMGSQIPYRIDFFDDKIDSIREFDPETQRSSRKISRITLLPANEFPFDDQAIVNFRTAWRDNFSTEPRLSSIYQEVSDGSLVPGIEYYLPLFFTELENIISYLSEPLVIKVGEVFSAAEKFWQDTKDRYAQYSHDITRPILSPDKILMAPEEFFALIKPLQQVELLSTNNKIDLDIKELPYFNTSKQKDLSGFTIFQKNFNGRILICCQTRGRKAVILELLGKYNIQIADCNNWDDFYNSNLDLAIIHGGLTKGFIYQNIAVITESELLDYKVVQTKHKKSQTIDPNLQIYNLAELNVGDLVVHIEHGIAKFQGLSLLDLQEYQAEFLTLEYADGNKLYVPVSALHLISRYSGVSSEHITLSTLGSDKWKKTKQKAAKQIRDVAAQLLQVYAKRQATKGFKFSAPDELYNKFCDLFPFEETPDQAQAIEQVIADLCQTKSMDRVICGDVGFGKTEVAMRAAYLAVQSGKQVAVLVPTTLLASQHYQSFVDRFSEFPITVEVLSRFKSNKEQVLTIDRIKQGKCDIVIGTHKLIQNGIEFHDLGLLIIDEEHRFGVRQKEIFKSYRAEVDILTMTATPIPRTLNMAMSGIRDLSIIATPPAKRLSVKTFVREYNKPLIQEAIIRELRRGGQIYYLHNDVATIQNTATILNELVPDAKVIIAHGQMPEKQLETVMTDFYHRKYNVLVCTTIIETGIDIPNANTIIIDRADKFGLAQLHQLRGRVGRSHHQAYAFYLTPNVKSITKDAVKRLDAIAAHDTLGVGFSLATHDLEIRGAGELLGDEQSGNINSLGFNLFMELLEHAVESLRDNKDFDIDFFNDKSVEIDLQVSALIPNEFILDVQLRLQFYKRIANVSSQSQLNDLKAEMIDRFGKLPRNCMNLFTIASFKLICMKIGISQIKLTSKGGNISFIPDIKINPEIIIRLIQSQPETYKLVEQTKLSIMKQLSEPDHRITFIGELLGKLSQH